MCSRFQLQHFCFLSKPPPAKALLEYKQRLKTSLPEACEEQLARFCKTEQLRGSACMKCVEAHVHNHHCSKSEMHGYCFQTESRTKQTGDVLSKDTCTARALSLCTRAFDGA